MVVLNLFTETKKDCVALGQVNNSAATAPTQSLSAILQGIKSEVPFVNVKVKRFW